MIPFKRFLKMPGEGDKGGKVVLRSNDAAGCSQCRGQAALSGRLPTASTLS